MKCIEYFSPAWDGYRLGKSPPNRQEVLEWGGSQESDGDLYDYDGDLEDIPLWDLSQSLAI